MVRVNAGCKGCVKPSSSLRREEKKRGENYLLRPCMKVNPLETVAKNSNTCPTKSMIQSAKHFSPKALQLGYQLLRTATNLIHVDLT